MIDDSRSKRNKKEYKGALESIPELPIVEMFEGTKDGDKEKIEVVAKHSIAEIVDDIVNSQNPEQTSILIKGLIQHIHTKTEFYEKFKEAKNEETFRSELSNEIDLLKNAKLYLPQENFDYKSDRNAIINKLWELRKADEIIGNKDSSINDPPAKMRTIGEQLETFLNMNPEACQDFIKENEDLFKLLTIEQAVEAFNGLKSSTNKNSKSNMYKNQLDNLSSKITSEFIKLSYKTQPPVIEQEVKNKPSFISKLWESVSGFFKKIGDLFKRKEKAPQNQADEGMTSDEKITWGKEFFKDSGPAQIEKNVVKQEDTTDPQNSTHATKLQEERNNKQKHLIPS